MKIMGSAVLTAALLTVSCGGGGSPSSPSGPAGSTSVVTINITGQGGTSAFSPNPATVDANSQTVMFKNNDKEIHHIILDDGSKQTSDIPPGASSVPITIGGSGSYHCTIHPGMVGGFNGDKGDPPSSCTGAYCSTVGGGGGD
jgi:plastocyanin